MISKYVLVLGAKSDIGEALAYQFAEKGYHLILAGRDADKYLKALAADLQVRYNILATIAEFDGRKFSTHADFYNDLSAKPNIVISVFGVLGEQSEAEKHFSKSLDIIQANYTGHVSILNIIANDFADRQSGTIIGISSVAGERGRQSNYIYGSSKAAFSTYIDGLRNRLHAKNVAVINVKPGFVATKMTAHLPLPKLLTATPQQVSKAIFNAYRKKKDTIYVLFIWRYIMLIIKNIPEFIFKRLQL